MTHCVDFWKKWKTEPNFCGLGSSVAKQYDKYLTFVDEFSTEFEIDSDIVYRNVPQSSIKRILQFKKSSDIRKKAEKSIADTLKSKRAITSKYVDSVIEIVPRTKKLITEPKVVIAPLSESHQETIASNQIKDKIRMLTTVLTTGQIEVLLEVAKQNNLDNEYEAMVMVIKWASEKINK